MESEGQVPDRASPSGDARRTILVVDDEEHVLRTVARTLETHGYAVLQAQGGARRSSSSPVTAAGSRR